MVGVYDETVPTLAGTAARSRSARRACSRSTSWRVRSVRISRTPQLMSNTTPGQTERHVVESDGRDAADGKPVVAVRVGHPQRADGAGERRRGRVGDDVVVGVESRRSYK